MTNVIPNQRLRANPRQQWLFGEDCLKITERRRQDHDYNHESVTFPKVKDRLNEKIFKY